MEAHHQGIGKERCLALDNGSCDPSQVSETALAARAAWLRVIGRARYSPELPPKAREWRQLKRDARRHRAPTLSAFVADSVERLHALGGTRLDSVDEVPAGFLAGHRREPTGRPPGRPKGAKDSYKRAPYRKRAAANLPAAA